VNDGRLPAEHGAAEQEVLAKIWRDCLGVAHVRPTDNFFGLGGHSLKAVQMLQTVNDVFGIEMPLSAIAETATLQSMMERILAERSR
jgi:acyl carrier protein